MLLGALSTWKRCDVLLSLPNMRFFFFKEPEIKVILLFRAAPCLPQKGAPHKFGVAPFGWGTQGRPRKVRATGESVPEQMQDLLLLVRSALLGGRVIQAHVLLACSSAGHPAAVCHCLNQMLVTRLLLLHAISGFTWLGVVLPGRREGQ